MVMTRSRTKKLLDTQTRNKDLGGEDRISQLPDDVIQHILSFVPTKSAVSTTVLSKRWNNVWVDVQNLDFIHKIEEDSDDDDYDEEVVTSGTNRFMDFVDRVLTLRRRYNMSSIHKFCLTCDSDYFDGKRVRNWISTAVESKVEEVNLFFRCLDEMLPIDLFNSESLIKLEIGVGVDNYDKRSLDLPESISFLRLRTLRLCGIVFQEEVLAQKLFSSCSQLEDLYLDKCVWEDTELISISAPKLKSFTLVNHLDPSSYMKHVELKIDAPSLMSIKYDDWLPYDLVVNNSQSLIEVDLCFLSDFYDNFDFDSISKFIAKLSNAQRLRLSTGYRYKETMSLLLTVLSSVPTFEKLIHLEAKYSQADTVLKVLQFTPNLESLVLDSWVGRKKYSFTSNLVPPCLLLHLKTIKIRNFIGLQEELKLVKYFLKNASCLQIFIIESWITSKSVAELEKRTQVMELLRMYPKASTDCKLEFQDPE